MTEIVTPQAESYAESHTTPLNGQLAQIAEWTRANTAWPGMMSGLAEARLLQALAVVGGAQRVLEIGTFTALGTLALAAALPPGGRIITLEVDAEMAQTARRHIAASPFSDRIELVLGDALATLETLEGPFDLVYVDARKADYPGYYAGVLPKLSERGIIVADNLFRAGAVLADGEHDEGTVAMRDFARQVQEDERVDNVLLTVGDGLMLAWRRPAAPPLS